MEMSSRACSLISIVIVLIVTIEPCTLHAIVSGGNWSAGIVAAVVTIATAWVSKSPVIWVGLALAWVSIGIHLRFYECDAPEDFTVRAPEPLDAGESMPGPDPLDSNHCVQEGSDASGETFPLSPPDVIASAQTNEVPRGL